MMVGRREGSLSTAAGWLGDAGRAAALLTVVPPEVWPFSKEQKARQVPSSRRYNMHAGRGRSWEQRIANGEAKGSTRKQ